MTLTAAGFDGTVFEQTAATLFGFAQVPCAESSTALKVSAVSGQDRKVRVAVGQYFADGVIATVTVAEDEVLPVVTGSPKWYTICLNVDWTASPGGSVSIVHTGGGTTQAVSLGGDTTPGLTCNYPLALVQVRAGVQVPTAVIDLRDTVGEVRRGWKDAWVPITKSAAVQDSSSNGHTWAYRLSVPAGRVEIRGAIQAADDNFSGSGDAPVGSALPVEARPNRVQRHTAQSSNMNIGNSSTGRAIYVQTTRVFIDTNGQIHYNNPYNPSWMSFNGWTYDLN